MTHTIEHTKINDSEQGGLYTCPIETLLYYQPRFYKILIRNDGGVFPLLVSWLKVFSFGGTWLKDQKYCFEKDIIPK